MTSDIIFLLIEYSGIPIALMLYSVIIKLLSNNDPIPNNQDEESIWSYGLELMVITSVSTLLFALSFYGHTNGESVSSIKKDCIITGLIISIIEFGLLSYMTLKVRQWGKNDTRTKRYPNVIAFIYWGVLCIVIVGCTKYAHPSDHTIPNAAAEAGGTSINSWWIVAISVLGAIGVIFLIKYFIDRIKKKTIQEYNRGSRVLGTNSVESLKNLLDSLKRLPDTSSLVIDIHMKLARLYITLNQNDEALKQIESLEQKAVFKSLNSYLKDAILKSKFQILLNLDKVQEAETLVKAIESKDISDKLKLLLFNKRNAS